MGRGSGSSEKKVKKQRTLRKEAVISSGGSTSSGGGSSGGDSCLFSFDDRVNVSTNVGQGIKVADPVTLVPNFSSLSIDIYIGNKAVGKYNGVFLSKLLQCMRKRYVYEGEVQKIDRPANSLAINFSVQGKK